MRFDQPVIYQTTYKNKKYIGQHIGNGIDYVGGGKIIKDIVKSGNKHKLKTKVIEYVDDVNKLNEREIYWIEKLKPELNLTAGGEGNKGWIPSKITRERIRQKAIGRKLSKTTKYKMSLVRKGKKHSELTKEKIGKGRLGKLHTKEAKEKMSLAKKDIYLKEGNPFYGKTHTDEVKKKLSLARKLYWKKWWAKRKGRVA